MKNTVANRIVIAVFLLICLIPSLGMIFLGESKAGANEVPAKFPAVTDRDGRLNAEYLSGISDWAGDRFAFRQEMITAWSGLNSVLFGTSVEDKVVTGSSGWLYYSETLDDYRGLSLEDSRLEAMAWNLSLMQEYAESKGARFLFTIAPNKNSIYPEYMPDHVPHNADSANSKKLMPYLEKYAVSFADLFTAISHEEETLYFKTDSHWDSRGAALAADIILSGLDRESAYFTSAFSKGEAHRGDLYEMLFPAGKYTEDDFSYVPGFTFTTARDPNGGNAVNIESSSENGSGRLMCWRDSFGVALYPYLAESFREARFSRSAAYDLTRIDSEQTDSVLIEIVERNLSYLLENMPVYSAPLSDMPELTAQMPALEVSAEQGKTAATGDLVLLQAQIPEAYAESTSCGYFVCSGSCYKAAVLYPDGSSPVVSAWIPSADTGSISVIYGNEAACFISDAA